MSEEPIVVVDPKNQLSERERRAYDKHMQAGDAPLPTTVQARFFAAYMDGQGLEEIQQRNRCFQLGAIVRAAVEGEWTQLRRDYLTRLFATMVERLGQVQAESLGFVGDLLSVAHRQHGEKLRSYLQSGDEGHLKGAMTIQSIDTYRKVAETLLKLSGQDLPKPPEAPPRDPPPRDPDRAKEVRGVGTVVRIEAGVGRPMLAAEAEILLGALQEIEPEPDTK